MIVGGQSTTDDVIDINADLHSVVEEQACTIATLQAELVKWVNNVKKLEARVISETSNNRKLVYPIVQFYPHSKLIQEMLSHAAILLGSNLGQVVYSHCLPCLLSSKKLEYSNWTDLTI